MQSENYVTILSSFLKYKLPLNELMIYSIIYGFTQNGQKFSGSYEYLYKWVGCNSHTTIANALKNLRDKGLIIKVGDYRAKGLHYCEYIASVNQNENTISKNDSQDDNDAQIDRDTKNGTLKDRLPKNEVIDFQKSSDRLPKSGLNNTNILLDNIPSSINNNNTLDIKNNINNNLSSIKDLSLKDIYSNLDKYIPNVGSIFLEKVDLYSTKLPLELIDFAIKETASAGVRHANYFVQICENLIAENIKTIEEAEEYNKKRKEKIEYSKQLKDRSREVYVINNQPNAKAIKIHKAFEDMDKYIDMFSLEKDKGAIDDKKSS